MDKGGEEESARNLLALLRAVMLHVHQKDCFNSIRLWTHKNLPGLVLVSEGQLSLETGRRGW